MKRNLSFSKMLLLLCVGFSLWYNIHKWRLLKIDVAGNLTVFCFLIGGQKVKVKVKGVR